MAVRAAAFAWAFGLAASCGGERAVPAPGTGLSQVASREIPSPDGSRDRRAEVRSMTDLGFGHLRGGRNAEAAEALHAALRRITAFPDAGEERMAILLGLGHAWMAAKEFDQARLALEDARRRAPGWDLPRGEGHAVLGLLLLAREEGTEPDASLREDAKRLSGALPDPDLAGWLAAAAQGEPVDGDAVLRAVLPEGPPGE